jgi:hypothetical protein
MPEPQQNGLDYFKMDIDEGFCFDEQFFYECPCCKRPDIYMADLLFCDRCGGVFCINCDMAESMRLAHPDWPCPQCPQLTYP